MNPEQLTSTVKATNIQERHWKKRISAHSEKANDSVGRLSQETCHVMGHSFGEGSIVANNA